MTEQSYGESLKFFSDWQKDPAKRTGLNVQHTLTRGEYPTVSIEIAPIRASGSSPDWKSKITVQLTRGELTAFCSVLFGLRSKALRVPITATRRIRALRFTTTARPVLRSSLVSEETSSRISSMMTTEWSSQSSQFASFPTHGKLPLLMPSRCYANQRGWTEICPNRANLGTLKVVL